MILVTGGTGLVGTHLLLQLVREGVAVRATYREAGSLEQVKRVFSYYSDTPEALLEKIQWVQADINDIKSLESAFREVAYVYHCAALISFDPRDFKRLQKVNAEGTANVVNSCLAFQVRKLCYVSSIAAIGKPEKEELATEDDYYPDRNPNVYALSKIAAEMEVWRGSQEGLPVVIVNPGIILGPGYWDRGSGRVFGIAASRPRWYLPGGTAVVGIPDVIEIMVRLMRSPIQNERFICIERNLSYRELMVALTREFNLAPPEKALKIWQLKIGWRLDWVRSLLTNSKRRLTRNNVASMKQVTLYDNRKVKESLGYQFEPIEESIRLCCRVFREEHPALPG